jgi:hypothetical protein
MLYRRLSAVSAALAMVVAGFLISAAPAQARGDGGDNRPCVTRREFNTSMTSWNLGRIARYYDTRGFRWTTHRGGEWVDDGYWDDVYVEDGYWDIDGTWVDTSYWDSEWVDDSWFMRDYEDDLIQGYRKCGGWGAGRNVYVNFDNYTWTEYGLFGWRAYAGHPSNPRRLVQWDDARVMAKGRNADKAPVERGPLS